ncbi:MULTISPECIES: hypothetical protein [Nostoc]|uniref:DUF4351 domain-containing protein n=1 Tax=Nostoc paludosum FACHB-159 TaxID=2692908 RepID=A0ABR8KLD3_9NOSO|nr:MULTISPECIES: hypothetical protein [Nostoc]MBD2683486.1 hypothetical protein [Nostoc sp. FACHB-857]MBD2739810.1 hypothetical protein [Nostoc paludosum FACHB-159]
MTQRFYSQFVEHYLEQLLSPLGTVAVSGLLTDEERRGIVLFLPQEVTQTKEHSLRLLAKVAQGDCSIEVYCEPIDETDVRNCLRKLLSVFSTLNSQAQADGKTLDENDLPRLWIIVPSASCELLNNFGARLELENWSSGIYFLPDIFRLAIIAVDELPITPETLWLRILGKGETQGQAVAQLLALPESNQLRQNTLRLITNWRIIIVQQQETLTEDEQELIMNLSQAYQQWEETTKQQGIQEGVQQGQRQVVENLLRFRFGTVDEELARVVNSLLQLTPEEFTPLCLELSREDLLARFNSHQ